EAKKCFRESLQQQHLNQKSVEYNEAKRFFIDTYQPEEIYFQYIIRMTGKGYTVIDHSSKVYRMPDTHECIDGNQPLCLIIDIDARQKPDFNNPQLPSLDSEKITRDDLISRILVACADALSLIPDYYKELKGFTEKVIELVGEPYSKFIDVGLPKSCFSLRLLGSAKEERIKRPAISSVKNGFQKLDDYLVQPKENYSVIWPRTFSSKEPVKESQPINDENALSKRANLVIAKYEWLQIGKIEKEFINFQAQSCYRQKQYKPDHKGLSYDKVSDKVESKVKPKWRLIERLPKTVKYPRPLAELSEKNINVKNMEDAPEAYPDFSSEDLTTTLICSPVATGKTKTLREIFNSLAKSEANLPCFNWVSYHKTLSNETKSKVEVLQKSGLHVCHYQENGSDLSICDWDVIIVQVESTHRLSLYGESENAMHDLLKSAVHVVAMDTFANESTLIFLKQYRGENIRVFDNKYYPCKGETVNIIYDPDKGSEAIRRGLKMLQESKHVAFVITSCKKARVLADQVSKLQKPDGSPISTRVYFGQMDGKQRQEDFADINTTWNALDCVIYTSTIEAGISFEIPNHFDAVIGISNIGTGVHAKAFAQMLYRVRDCPLRIVSLYHSKKPSKIFKEPSRDLIRAELSALRPGDLPTIIKGHREWDKIADCYALDSSPAVETYIEVEYQRRFSAKYFPEILCSLIASTGTSLKLISVEDTSLAKATRVKVSNIIKMTEKNIKAANAELIANSPDISLYEAKTLKLNPEHSFADNMTLQ
ncbi:28870_t:CDS:2, partial [Gigaspora margarita]